MIDDLKDRLDAARDRIDEAMLEGLTLDVAPRLLEALREAWALLMNEMARQKFTEVIKEHIRRWSHPKGAPK